MADLEHTQGGNNTVEVEPSTGITGYEQQIIETVNQGIEDGDIEIPTGTEVVANPALEGGEADLNSIKIGDTKYKALGFRLYKHVIEDTFKKKMLIQYFKQSDMTLDHTTYNEYNEVGKVVLYAFTSTPITKGAGIAAIRDDTLCGHYEDVSNHFHSAYTGRNDELFESFDKQTTTVDDVSYIMLVHTFIDTRSRTASVTDTVTEL